MFLDTFIHLLVRNVQSKFDNRNYIYTGLISHFTISDAISWWYYQ